MRAFNLDQLRTLVTIDELGTFARAAQALHLAAPTVSLHVAELEARLGAPLLLRQRGRIVPTNVGASLIAQARQLLALADETQERLRRQIQGEAGPVRLGASTGVLAHLLPRALAWLGTHHPGIDVQVTVLTSQQSLSRLTQASLDIGLVALPQPSVTGLRLMPWRRDPVMAFVPADWPAPRSATPAWLATQPLILNDASTRLARLCTQWFARGGVHPRARIELNFNDAIKSLVAAGYGAALLPHEAGALPQDSRIRMLPLRPALWRPLAIAHRAGPLEASTARVVQALRS